MKSLLKTLLLALAIGAAPQALAGQLHLPYLLGQAGGGAIHDSSDTPDLAITQSDGPSLSEAVEMVKRQCKCRIVRAWTETSGGREVHNIRYMTKDGTVRTTKIQGRSIQP